MLKIRTKNINFDERKQIQPTLKKDIWTLVEGIKYRPWTKKINNEWPMEKNTSFDQRKYASINFYPRNKCLQLLKKCRNMNLACRRNMNFYRMKLHKWNEERIRTLKKERNWAIINGEGRNEMTKGETNELTKGRNINPYTGTVYEPRVLKEGLSTLSLTKP